jgi:membrane protein DedA with SNARE-associated domain
MHTLSSLFSHYGYIVLVVGLFLELIAFPTPGEVMMSYCGYLVFQGKMDLGLSILSAILGTTAGITGSYFIGVRLGYPFFKKHGTRIHLGPAQLDKTSKWFGKFGVSLLLVAYFIPGVRHITGYFSGISRISYKKFATSAYLGAIIWVTTFIYLGKIIGPKWEKYHIALTRYFILGGIILCMLMLLYYFGKTYKTQIFSGTINFLGTILKIFHSLGEVKIAITLVAAAFLGLVAFAIGLTQDFIGNEFRQLDAIVNFVIKSIYSDKWRVVMRAFNKLTYYLVIDILVFLLFIWIVKRGVDKFLEIRFLLINVFGAEVFSRLLLLIYHRRGNLEIGTYTFPSPEALMAVAVYGFCAFIIFRHSSRTWVRAGVLSIAIGLCFFSGQSVLFFQSQFPSDVVAGYVFGGIWLSLNIILLEIYRILPILKKSVIDIE